MSSILGDAFIRIKPKTDGFESEAKSGISRGMLAIAGGAAAAGAAIFEIGKKSVEAAATEQKSQVILANAFAHTGTSIDAQRVLVEHAQGTMQRYGYSAADTDLALAKLEISAKNPAKAMNDLGVAADLAAARQIPLATATALVAKAQQGSASALTRLGIVSADQAKKLKGHSEEILHTLEGMYGGAAEKVSHTAAGSFAALQAMIENTLGKIGQVLLPPLMAILPIVMKLVGVIGGQLSTIFAAITPTLQQLVPIVASLLTWVGTEISGILKLILPIIGVLLKVASQVITPILKLAEGFLKALLPPLMKLLEALMPSITKLLTAFLPLVPLLTVIINLLLKLLLPALSALTPIISTVISILADLISGALAWLINTLTDVIAWVSNVGQHFSGVFGAIEKIVMSVWNFIYNNALHPMYVFFKDTIIAQIQIVQSIFSTVFQGISDAVKGAWDFVVNTWDGIYSFFQGVVNTIANFASSMWAPLYNAFVAVANAIIIAYDDTIGWIPGMHVNTLTPIGGSGRGGHGHSAAQAKAAQAKASSTNAGIGAINGLGVGSVGTVNVNIHADSTTHAHEIAKAIEPHLKEHTHRLVEAIKAAK